MPSGTELFVDEWAEARAIIELTARSILAGFLDGDEIYLVNANLPKGKRSNPTLQHCIFLAKGRDLRAAAEELVRITFGTSRLDKRLVRRLHQLLREELKKESIYFDSMQHGFRVRSLREQRIYGRRVRHNTRDRTRPNTGRRSGRRKAKPKTVRRQKTHR